MNSASVDLSDLASAWSSAAWMPSFSEADAWVSASRPKMSTENIASKPQASCNDAWKLIAPEGRRRRIASWGRTSQFEGWASGGFRRL